MTGSELWTEVTDGATVEELVAGAKDASMTIEEAVKAAVTGWAELFDLPEGMTVETITAALVEYVNP